MSWHMKENYDMSEVHPRTLPPKGHGLNAVARVQPMVPEVSMFSNGNSEVRRQPLRSLNETPKHSRVEKSVEDSLCRTVPGKKPPLPSQPPMRGDYRSPELSKYVNNESVELPRRSDSYDFEKQKAMLKNPQDLFKVLSWQNEQLMRLQEQVRQLLACQQSSPCRSEVSVMSTSSLPAKFADRKASMVDSSTQVSAPSTPMKRNDEASVLRERDQTNRTLEASFQNDENLQGAVGGQTMSPIVPQPQFDDDEDDDEIQCHDIQPVQDLDQLIGQFGNFNAACKEPELTIATEESCVEVRRLKEMGVSFISKEDLYPNNKKDDKELDPSMWYPQAVDPFLNCPSVTSTSDYSLMINSAALKYLNDAQLTHVAKKSPQNMMSSPLEPANVTRYGLPEHNISKATRDFLSAHDLSKHLSSDHS